MPPTSDPAPFHAAWESALDELELDVEHAERLLRAGDTPEPDRPAWQPPTLRGPLPASLRDRAALLLSRQLHAADGLVLAMHANREQRAVADRFDTATTATARPVYVDRDC